MNMVKYIKMLYQDNCPICNIFVGEINMRAHMRYSHRIRHKRCEVCSILVKGGRGALDAHMRYRHLKVIRYTRNIAPTSGTYPEWYPTPYQAKKPWRNKCIMILMHRVKKGLPPQLVDIIYNYTQFVSTMSRQNCCNVCHKLVGGGHQGMKLHVRDKHKDRLIPSDGIRRRIVRGHHLLYTI